MAVRESLTNTQKKEILKFRAENRGISYKALVRIFSEKWDKNLNQMQVFRIVRDKERILEIPDKMKKSKKKMVPAIEMTFMQNF